MPTQLRVARALILWSINARKEVDVEHCTHLAIVWGCTVETNQYNNYDREAGQARN
jgi:hypothetical protein